MVTYIWMAVWDAKVYTRLKAHHWVLLRFVHFMVCKIYIKMNYKNIELYIMIDKKLFIDKVLWCLQLTEIDKEMSQFLQGSIDRCVTKQAQQNVHCKIKQNLSLSLPHFSNTTLHMCSSLNWKLTGVKNQNLAMGRAVSDISSFSYSLFFFPYKRHTLPC